jgi:hypothetical protein
MNCRLQGHYNNLSTAEFGCAYGIASAPLQRGGGDRQANRSDRGSLAGVTLIHRMHRPFEGALS